MPIRMLVLYLWTGWLLAGFWQAGYAQQTPSDTPLASSTSPRTALKPEDISARKAAIQAEMETLAKGDAAAPDRQERQALLEDTSKTLDALAEALQRRSGFEAKIQGLPGRLKELSAEADKLARRPPSEFPKVSEELREQYRTKLDEARAHLQDLHKDAAQGEVRLASIPKELEQLGEEKAGLEQSLESLNGEAAKADPQSLSRLRVDLLNLKLQLNQTSTAALEAERAWLVKRSPFDDAMLNVAQLRLEALQRDLDTIRQALDKALKKEQAGLRRSAADIAEKKERPQGPAEKAVLDIGLATVEIRRTTADYRERLNTLSEQALVQARRNAQARQTVDRLRALVEKYQAGDVPAQGVFVLFDRLQRERVQAGSARVSALRKELQQLNAKLFALDDRLYEFDGQADEMLSRLRAELKAGNVQDVEAAVAAVRKPIEEQKAALRGQQQALTSLVQGVSKLLALHQEHVRLLEDGYLFALNNIFWLPDARPLSWSVVKDMLRATDAAMTQVTASLGVAEAELRQRLSGSSELWIPALLVVLALPLAIFKLNRWLKIRVDAAIAAQAANGKPPGMGSAVVGLMRSALWPAYVALIAWLVGWVLALNVEHPELALALLRGLRMAVLMLWVGVVGYNALRDNGWGQHYWGTPAVVNRYVQRAVLAVTLAALIFLVPRQVVLSIPVTAEGASAGMQALARMLFLAFQSTLFVVVLIVGQRNGLVVRTLLAESRKRNSLRWRLWPLAHLAAAGAGLAYIALDAFGYSYAAAFLWFKIVQSLLVLLVLRLLVMVSVSRGIEKLVDKAFGISAGGLTPAREAVAERTQRIASVLADLLLMLIAAGIILQIWGVSVLWVLASPLVSRGLIDALLMAAALGGAILAIQLSRMITERALRPKIMRSGFKQLPGRKLQTLMPLTHTVVRLMAFFVAALVILQLMGVQIGPILAGVGIFGLAVGFAAQSLIKDFINGLFILFEGSLALGDIVQLRGIGGQVEKFTLRAVTIRDLSGNVHVIPNSGIDMVTNMTKGYSRYLLDVGVAYREDVDTVIAILREIDEEMRRDPAYARDMLEPIEIMGLDRFEDSAVIVRARLKTRPIEQWRIGREFNRRMKKVFDQRGIEIPFPHRTVYWGQSKEAEQPPLEVTVKRAGERHAQGARRGASMSPGGISD